jgi:hypothetical protein
MLLLSGSAATDRQRHHAAAAKASRAEIDAGLARAEQESLAAIEQANAGVAAYLGACRQNSHAFAGWMLSLRGGKASYAMGRADQAWTFVKHLAQTGTAPATSSLPDRFGAEVRQKYAEMVVSPESTRSVIAQAVMAYAARLRDIDAKLAVELGADVSDEALTGQMAQPFDAAPLISSLDATLAEATKVAEGDLLLGIVREVLMYIAGDAISDQVGADQWHPALNIGADTGVGMALDRIADAGLKRLGYAPEAKVKSAIEQSVDRLTFTTLTQLRATLTEAHTKQCARRAAVLRAALEGR